MRLKIDDVKSFQKSLEAILTIQEEVKINFKPESMEVLAIDDGLVTMIYYIAPKELFSEYSVENESILLNIDELNRVLKNVRNESVILEVKDNRLIVSIEGNVKRVFQIPLLEEIKKEIDQTPPINWKNLVELEGDLLKNALKDASFVDDAEINIIMDENTLTFLAKSSLKEYKLEIPKDSPVVLTYDYKEDINNLYGLNQLNELVNNIPKGSIVKIELSNKTPIKLEFKIGMIKIIYIMADRG